MEKVAAPTNTKPATVEKVSCSCSTCNFPICSKAIVLLDFGLEAVVAGKLWRTPVVE